MTYNFSECDKDDDLQFFSERERHFDSADPRRGQLHPARRLSAAGCDHSAAGKISQGRIGNDLINTFSFFMFCIVFLKR